MQMGIHAMKVTKHVHTTTPFLPETKFASCDIYILLHPDENLILQSVMFLSPFLQHTQFQGWLQFLLA